MYGIFHLFQRRTIREKEKNGQSSQLMFSANLFNALSATSARCSVSLTSPIPAAISASAILSVVSMNGSSSASRIAPLTMDKIFFFSSSFVILFLLVHTPRSRGRSSPPIQLHSDKCFMPLLRRSVQRNQAGQTAAALPFAGHSPFQTVPTTAQACIAA